MLVSYYFCFMKAYFLQLFGYDHFANQLIMESIIKANSPEKPVQLMAHLLAAQQVWLARCKSEPAPGIALWPDWGTYKLELLIDENNYAWINYLESLVPEDLNKMISYKNSRGDSFENTLIDILAHVINHGTHHRAQIGQYLKTAGFELPNTDYITYIRTR